MRYNYYVAVKTGKRKWRYVTGLLQYNYAEWKNHEKAKKFSLSTAKDLVYGLSFNGFFARIEIYPNYVENIGNNIKEDL